MISAQMLRDCIALAGQAAVDIFDADLDEVLSGVVVRETTRSSSIAGRMVFGDEDLVVEINTALCQTDAELRKTLCHELAHVVCEVVSHGTGHGKLWRAVMTAMGQEPVRCHEIDLAERLPDKYTKTVCSCGEVFYMTHGLAGKPGTGFYCHACGSRLDTLGWQEYRNYPITCAGCSQSCSGCINEGMLRGFMTWRDEHAAYVPDNTQPNVWLAAR